MGRPGFFDTMDEQFSGLPQSVRKRTHVGGLGRSRRCEQSGADLGDPGLERADRRVNGRDSGEGVALAVGNHTARAFRHALVKRRIERADSGFDLGPHHRACNPRQRIDRGDRQAVDGDMQPFGQCDRAQARRAAGAWRPPAPRVRGEPDARACRREIRESALPSFPAARKKRPSPRRAAGACAPSYARASRSALRPPDWATARRRTAQSG